MQSPSCPSAFPLSSLAFRPCNCPSILPRRSLGPLGPLGCWRRNPLTADELPRSVQGGSRLRSVHWAARVGTCHAGLPRICSLAPSGCLRHAVNRRLCFWPTPPPPWAGRPWHVISFVFRLGWNGRGDRFAQVSKGGMASASGLSCKCRHLLVAPPTGALDQDPGLLSGPGVRAAWHDNQKLNES